MATGFVSRWLLSTRWFARCSVVFAAPSSSYLLGEFVCIQNAGQPFAAILLVVCPACLSALWPAVRLAARACVFAVQALEKEAPKSSGLKAINAVDDGMEDVPFSRRKKKAEEQAMPEPAPAPAAASAEAVANDAPVVAVAATAIAAGAVAAAASAGSAPGTTAGALPVPAGASTEAPPHASASRAGAAEATAAAATAAAAAAAAAAADSAQKAEGAVKSRTAAAARLAVMEKHIAPKTSYEFLSCWQGCVARSTTTSTSSTTTLPVPRGSMRCGWDWQ